MKNLSIKAPRTKNLNEIQQSAIARLLDDSRISYEEIQVCPLCSNQDRLLISNSDQYSIPLATYICNNCLLIYSGKQYTQESTEIFYREYYRKIYEGIHRPSLDHGYYKKLYSGWVPRVPAFIRKSALVTEIGCGGGWNLLPFLKKGIDCVGYDFDKDCLDFGRKNYGLDLRYGGIVEARSDGRKSDYVILSHVLEHTKDPKNFLIEVTKLLNPAGLICVRVPCVDYMRWFGGDSTHFSIDMNLQNAHNFFFSESTLRILLRECGLSLVLVLGGYVLARRAPLGGKSQQIQHSPKVKSKDILDLLLTERPFKHVLERILPKVIFNNVLMKLFYVARIRETIRYISINFFGFVPK